MANELKHVSVGTEITQAEYEGTAAHVFNSQATGDIMYASSSSQLTRLGIGSTGAVLTVTGGVPAWDTTWTPTGHLIPATDDSYDLGSASAAWQDLFLEGDITLTDAGTIATSAGALTITSAAAATWSTSAGALTIDGDDGITLQTTGSGNVTVAEILDITDATDSSDASGDTGALRTEGGASIAKKLYVGTDLDVDGTANLDAVDIDGAIQIDNTITVGANDQGYDIIFYGDAASANMTWDTSVDDLIFNGAARIVIPDGQLVLGSTAVSSTAAELNVLDNVTAGTVSASLGVVVDSNKDIGSFRNITLTGELDAGSLDISGNADIDGTLEADAITVDGTTLAEYISDTAGAMFTSNTETGITATYQDADNTIDLVVGTLNQDTTGTAAIATTVTITDNESTNETNAVIFTAGGDVDGGNLGLESDGDFTYNPSSGTVAATTFSGALSGNATTATALASGRTIAMTGDVAWTSASFDGSGNVTGAGTIQANAVEGSMLNNNTISGQTEITSGLAAADELLYNDGGVLKKVGLDTLTSYLAGVNAGTVTSTGISDSSGVLTLDIQNMTASSTADDADLIVIDDGAGGTLRKQTRAHFLSGVGGGITYASNWTLTSDFNAGAVGTGTLTANLAASTPAAGRFGSIGSAMTVVSGEFTFPATGVWYVAFHISIFGSGNGTAEQFYIETSDDGFSSDSAQLSRCMMNKDANEEETGMCSAIIDVTNTSNDQVRFTYADVESNITIAGSGANNTWMEFIRLGDT